MASVDLNVSLTELGPYRRLVDFLEEAELLAEETGDVELDELVRNCRVDLLELRS